MMGWDILYSGVHLHILLNPIYVNSKKYKKWSLVSLKINDGSRIIISRKKEEEPFDRTEFAKELTAIAANLAQALTIVILAKN